MPPVLLSNVAASSITRSGATITWTTDRPASSLVEYGPTPAYGVRAPLDPSLLQDHTLVLDGLLPGLTYHYRVTSVAPGGGVGVSADAIFTTAPAGSGPDILGLGVRRATSSTVLVGWTAPTGVAAQVEYGATANYGRFTLLHAYPGPAQTLTLDGLAPQTRYHLRVKVWDSAGYLSSSADLTFSTAPLGTATLFGEPTLQLMPASLPAGQAAAFQYVAAQSGLASRVRLYVDQGSTSSLVRVALYADQNGAPGSILAQGSGVPSVGWTSLSISPTPLAAGTRYWLAVLSPLGTGALGVRQAPLGGSSQLSAQTTLGAFPATWRPGTVGAGAPLTAYVQQVAPSVSVTGPDDGSTVTGLASLTAVVDDDAPISSLEFLVDGVPVGAPQRSAPFGLAWDSRAVPGAAPHTISARVTDVLGRSATSAGVLVGVDNGPVLGPARVERGLTASSVRVTWSSDVPADSEVEYGPSVAYGLQTPLDAGLQRSHAQELTGLEPGTTYHLRVHSRDAAGVAASSADVTFTTPALDAP